MSARYEIEADGVIIWMPTAQSMRSRVARMRRNGIEPTITQVGSNGYRQRLVVDTTPPEMQVRPLRTSKWS